MVYFIIHTQVLMCAGDEQTWDMVDWNWDPYNLSAVPKEANTAAPCCQALKKRKVADQPTAARTEHAAAIAQQQQQQYAMAAATGGYSCTTGSSCPPTGAAGCCSFQLPQNMGMQAQHAAHAAQMPMMPGWPMGMGFGAWPGQMMPAMASAVAMGAMPPPAMQAPMSSAPIFQPQPAAVPAPAQPVVKPATSSQQAETSQGLGSTHASFDNHEQQDRRGTKRDEAGSGCCSKAHSKENHSSKQVGIKSMTHETWTVPGDVNSMQLKS